jgi:heme exporter protein D
MKKFVWLVVGVAVGFVVAHEVNQTKQGKQFFSDLDSKAREFGEAISDGYRQREAELRDAITEDAHTGDAPER